MVISRKRLNILNFIREFLGEHDYAPTVRDIVKGCRISTSSVVQYHLNLLEKEGYIKRDAQVFRSIRLMDKDPFEDRRRAPLLGTIAAGEPIPVLSAETWQSEVEEYVPLSEEMSRGGAGVYALRVRGKSMIDALIDDGDVVLMQPVRNVSDGDMVAVWLRREQETTLKRLYREPGRIRLQPANAEMMPFFHDPENVEVQGRVVGVIRHLR